MLLVKINQNGELSATREVIYNFNPANVKSKGAKSSKLVKGDSKTTNYGANWTFRDNNAELRNNLQEKHKNITAM